MIDEETFNHFINSYHPDYNQGILRPLSWCHIPHIEEDGYIQFIRKSNRQSINTTFYAKLEENKIKIKVIYYYFGDYEETSFVYFNLIDYRTHTYESFTLNNKTVNYLADQEILTFIKQFDNFLLELIDIPITKGEYDLYMKHLKNKPELIQDHESKNCKFKISFYFEHSYIVIRVTYENKKYKDSQYIDSQYFEYVIFKNRLEDGGFNDLDNDVHFEVSQRIDEIYYDAQLFFSIICFI